MPFKLLEWWMDFLWDKTNGDARLIAGIFFWTFPFFFLLMFIDVFIVLGYTVVYPILWLLRRLKNV